MFGLRSASDLKSTTVILRSLSKGTLQASPLAGAIPVPILTLTLTGPLTYLTSAASGSLVANIGNVPTGVTPTLTPNDGRLVIGGSAGAWTVATGPSASVAGTITLTVAAVGANAGSADVIVIAGGVIGLGVWDDTASWNDNDNWKDAA